MVEDLQPTAVAPTGENDGPADNPGVQQIAA